jgi:hypothetical protein
VTSLAIVMRVQRRLAIRTMSMLFGGLVLIPLILALATGLNDVRLGSVPVVWLLLGGVAYPALWLLAAHHRRAVDRLDRALVDRGTRESH